MLAYVWLAQKMERSPDKPWAVPANHLVFLRAMLDQMAECLRSLSLVLSSELPMGRQAGARGRGPGDCDCGETPHSGSPRRAGCFL